MGYRNFQLDVRTDHPAQHSLYSANSKVDIHDSTPRSVPAAEGQKMVGQGCCPACRIVNLSDVFRSFSVRSHMFAQQLTITGDDGEQIIAVVHDPAGECPD